jgi:hypothetical protein
VIKNQLQLTVDAATVVLQEFAHGKFSIPREEGIRDIDESLLRSCERAVWVSSYDFFDLLQLINELLFQFEAEKFVYILSRIRVIIEEQCAWMSKNESELIQLMENTIVEKFLKESSVTERLIDLISDQIMLNEPIRCEWRVTTDALAVISDRLVYPDNPPAVIPTVRTVYADQMNEEQMETFTTWLESAKLGEFILEQDLDHILDRALSTVGPFSMTHHRTYEETALESNIRNLVLPSELRKQSSRVKDLLLPLQQCRPGTKEHSGVLAVSEVISKMKEVKI